MIIFNRWYFNPDETQLKHYPTVQNKMIRLTNANLISHTK